MAEVLFWLTIVSTFGMVIIPSSRKTRGGAVFSWLAQLIAAGGFTYARVGWFPTWQEPDWANGWVWVICSWLLFIGGFIIAIRKPRKNQNVVA